jgi:hypothetical protein
VISLEDNSQVVESFSQSAGSKNSNGIETFNLVFKGTEGSVKIKANFTNKNGTSTETGMRLLFKTRCADVLLKRTRRSGSYSNATIWAATRCLLMLTPL